MAMLRQGAAESVTLRTPCCRCRDHSRPWDRIAGKTYCPNCLERILHGDDEPIVERPTNRRCAVCQRRGGVGYATFPLHARRPIEIDLCAEHLRALVARSLGPHAFDQLRRQLAELDLATNDVFLLHDAFYDASGRARQPVDGLA